MVTIHYRQVTSIPDLEAVVDLQKIVWNMDERGADPAHLLRAATHAGGVVIGAYHDETLIGFTWGFPAKRDVPTLWSDMAGVHPDYRSQGIGFALKQAQRHWALANGYRVIGWTFDPLQRRNAHFNLRMLGATSNVYLPNFYGAMDDALNAGMPSDRLDIVWDLEAPRVVDLVQGHSSPLLQAYPEADFILSSGDSGDPIVHETPELRANWHFAEIPSDIQHLKQTDMDKARRWQEAISYALQSAFRQSYTAVDFVAGQERCWYVLAHAAHAMAYNTLLARP